MSFKSKDGVENSQNWWFSHSLTFNIALHQGRSQSVADRDVTEGNTDIPKKATLWTMETLEPNEL